MTALRTTTKQRGTLRPWRPGQSGNPGGRPKVAGEFRERARKAIDDEGFEILLGMMREQRAESEDRRYALTKLLEYAYGRPTLMLGSDAEMPLQFSLRIDRGIDDLDALPEPTPNGHVLP